MIQKRNILFIINPISGIGKKNIIPSLIEKYLNQDIFDFEIQLTEYRNHGYEIAIERSQEFDAIIAVGGDGSVNEIGSALVGSKCALGIIPTGSGNGLARHLKIPLKASKAIERISNFELLKIDTGTVNDKVFLGTCGFGFDAHIAKKFDEFHKRGFTSYAKLVAKEFKKYETQLFQINIDGKKIEKRAFMCSVANSSQFGNGFVISPNSDIQDGIFELIFLKEFNLINVPAIGTRFFTSSIHKSNKFESFSFKDKLEINLTSASENFYHIDGEALSGTDQFTIKINKRSLNMI